MIRVASVCSGIGGAELAFAGIGHPVFVSEIEPFPRAVLAHHFPHLRLYGDFTEIRTDEPVDVLVGGTPCQSFSVAGLRGGMADARGNLALEFLRLADRLRAQWVLWENVPGVLSSSGGRDFGTFVGGLAELGYGWAYRTLDAQFFGLAQRRKRVFVVGCLGDWRRAAAVLFEPACLRGDPPPRREAREGIAGTLAASLSGSDENDAKDGRLIPYSIMPQNSGRDYTARRVDVAQPLMAGGPVGGNQGGDYIARCLNAHPARIDGESETFVTVPIQSVQGVRDKAQNGMGIGQDGATFGALAFHENQRAELTMNDTAGALKSGGGKPGQGYPAIAFQSSQSGVREVQAHATLDANNGSRRHNGVATTSSVRRLTPTECERLQGYPDVRKSVTILVCSSDRQRIAALAATPSLRSQQSAWNAGDDAFQQSAQHAAAPSSISLLGQDWPVVLNARINLERQEVALRSQGRLLASVNGAGEPILSLPTRLSGAFVRLLATTPSIVASETQRGKAASPQNTIPSTHPWNGSAYATASGQEIAALVADVERFTEKADNFSKFITSAAAQNSPISDEILATWSCYVAAAIALCIPGTTSGESSYALNIEAISGWTAITYRGKPAADGPRYRALGNAFAVPVVRWIARRLAAEHSAQQQEVAA